MKKSVLIAIAAVGFLAVSCKKDYTCSCSGTNLPANFTKFDYGKTKKKDAEDACSTQQSQIRSAGFSDATCSI